MDRIPRQRHEIHSRAPPQDQYLQSTSPVPLVPVPIVWNRRHPHPFLLRLVESPHRIPQSHSAFSHHRPVAPYRILVVPSKPLGWYH